MSPAPGPNDLTRQQLDELDVLLQRMLGLPLDPPAPAPRPAPLPPPPLPDLPPDWRPHAGGLARPDPHTATLSPAFVSLAATTAVAERPGLRRPPVVEAEVEAADPEVRFGPPTEGTGLPTGPFPRTVRGVDAPALPAGFKPAVYVEPEPAPPPPAVELKPAPPARPALPPGRPLPVALWPLFACNWVLETACGLGGPAGAAAVRPAGKHVLGGLGVVLLGAAAAWTARGLGLVDFPVPARPSWGK